MVKIFIIILNYNNYQDTQNCIKHIQRSDLPSRTEIVIVDNSKDDVSKEILRTTFPNIKLIKTNRNRGFSNGNNHGIRYALKKNATHIMIINPDVTVKKSFLKPLLTTFGLSNKVGMVSPVHLHQQNKRPFFGLGGKVNWLTSGCTQINTKTLKIKKAKKYEFVSFACVLIKREVFEKVGLLNESYFMYLEDVDYCLTANKAGFRCYVEPKVLVNHNTSSSFDIPTKKLRFSFISQLKFIRKWFRFPKNIIAYTYMFPFYIYLYLLWTYHYHKNK